MLLYMYKLYELFTGPVLITAEVNQSVLPAINMSVCACLDLSLLNVALSEISLIGCWVSRLEPVSIFEIVVCK